jgi:maltose alpha-D-glucosyltransferase/alpha-amylase
MQPIRLSEDPIDLALPTRTRPGLADDPLWYKDAVIYQVHVRGFLDSNDDGVGDFVGLTRKLDYIQSLGVSAVWLQPFYPSPLRDDGYDIAHYEGVHPAYGTRRDFLHFMHEAHERGLHVITELVINHTSDQHPWFQAARRARRGTSKRNFYVWSDDDRKYPGVPIVFKDVERSNWTWDPVAGQYYWHRFFHHQPDLNFDEPRVRKAVLKVMRFWLDMGVDGMRLDAVPYLVEREGTQCANLPETHAILKEIRRELDARYPNRMLLAEANQWPSDVRAYFGDGDECHMAFHFPLMPRLFMALRQEDRHPLSEILYQMPDIPDICQWATFLRNHDELTLEMVSDEERDYMYEAYAADPQMRLNVGIRRRLAPLMENSRPRIELMTALLISLPGTPVLYYGDELGMGDNIYLGDRNGVRTPMQWNADRNGGFSRADPARLYAPLVMDPVYGYQSVNVEAQERSPHSLLAWMRRTIALRQRHVTFGRGTMELLRPVNRRIFAFIRRYDAEDPILVVANLSRTVQAVSLDLARVAGLVPVEMFGGVELPRISDAPYFLTLGPYAFLWLKLQREPPAPLGGRSAALVPEVDPDQAPLLVGPEWPKLLDTSVRHMLERRHLPLFLQRQPWVRHGSSDVARLTIADWGVLESGDEPTFMIVLDVDLTDGGRIRYTVPLVATPGERGEDIVRYTPDAVVVRIAGARKGVLHGRVDGPLGRAIVNVVTGGRGLALHSGRLQPAPSAALAGLNLPRRIEDLGTAPFDNDRFPSSASYGERVRVEIVRRMWPGASPECALSEDLNAYGFARTPTYLGAVEYVDRDGTPTTIAVLNTFVPHQADGWGHALAELERYFDLTETLGPAPIGPASLPSLWTAEALSTAQETVGSYLQTASVLGLRAAELHRALAALPASDADRATADARAADTLADRAAAAWERARAALVAYTAPTDSIRLRVERLVAESDQMLETIRAARARVSGVVPLTRIHGSFDLAHVLLHEGDFTFLSPGDDTSESPERRLRWRSPLADIATMLRSFHLAAGAALASRIGAAPQQIERLAGYARWWTASASSAFLLAYRTATSDAPFLPANPDATVALLQLYMLEQTFNDVRPSLMSHPDWMDLVLTTPDVI